MRANKKLLNLSYTLLALWWLTYWYCTKVPIIFFPPVFIFVYGLLPVFVLFAVWLIASSDRWRSESRIVAIALVIPILWTFIGHQAVEQVKIRFLPPREAAIASFIQLGGKVGLSREWMDTEEPFVFFNRKTKHLDLHIRFRSYGYWDETLIVRNEFTRVHNRYRMNTPVSQIELIANPHQFYLEYTVDDATERIFLTDSDRAFSFRQSFWPSTPDDSDKE